MAVSLELFDTPASRLNSFVAQCQPNIQGVERRCGEGCAVRGEVPEGAALPGGPWAGPEGAEGDSGGTGPPPFSQPGLGKTQPMGPCL